MDYIECDNQDACLYDCEVLMNVFSREADKTKLREVVNIMQSIVRGLRPETKKEKVIFAQVDRLRFQTRKESDGYSWQQCTIIAKLKVQKCGKEL